MQQTSLTSFPAELLQEIAQLTSSLCILRQVCRTFNNAIAPQLFSRATIRFKEGKQDEFFEYLEALATGAHVAQVYARVLSIQDLCPPLTRPGNRRYPPDERDQEEDLKYQLEVLDRYDANSQFINEQLPLALGGFTNVRRVTWVINQTSHTWSRDSVVVGLARMACLKTLALNVNAYQQVEGSINLSSLPPLQGLTINAQYSTTIADDGNIIGVPELIAKSSSQLLQLAIKIPNDQLNKDHSLLDTFFQPLTSPLRVTHLRLGGFFVRLVDMTLASHLRSLVSLQLRDATKHSRRRYFRSSPLESPTEYSDIWDVLRQEKIYLRDIELDEPTNSFMQYLRSYSGLKALNITSAAGFTAADSNELAHNFYRSALATHAKSIEKLEILAAYEGLWCFGNHCIDALQTLVKLKSLTISIIADSGKIVPAIGAVTMRFPGSNKAPEPQPCTYDPMHPVCSLIETASALPVLRVLTICKATLARNRGVRCGNGLMRHAIPVANQIDTHVTSIGPLDPSKYRFAVFGTGKHYILQQSEKDGGFRYRCIRGFSESFIRAGSWCWQHLDQD